MAAFQHDVVDPGGRRLRVVEDGDLHGRPVFVLHGTPGSRLLYAPHVADAARRRIRLIGHDRAGYGGSTRHAGRNLADAATDVRAIADALGIDRFAVWGHSGGGAPALACAAAMPDRVVAASSLAGVAPHDADGLDWLAGMGELNVEDFRLMMSDRSGWESKAEEEAKLMRGASVEQIEAFLSSLLSDRDRAALSTELGSYFQVQARVGLEPGAGGVIDDNLASAKAWGFELSAIRVPVQLWHGQDDRFVPFAHGKWLAARLPHADVHLEAEEGHVTLFARRIPEVHGWLLSHF